jgi:hypothetical protein
MGLAQRVFTIAGVYGLVVLLPLYALEERLGADMPPPITHPEYYYGFLGVAVAWQVAFLLIGRDPVGLRPMMIPAILEKLGYGLAVVVLWLEGRAAAAPLATGLVDLLWAGAFAAARARTPPA